MCGIASNLRPGVAPEIRTLKASQLSNFQDCLLTNSDMRHIKNIKLVTLAVFETTLAG